MKYSEWELVGLCANADPATTTCQVDCERCRGSAIDSVPIAANKKLVSQARTIDRLRALADGYYAKWKKVLAIHIETAAWDHQHELRGAEKERKRIVVAIRAQAKIPTLLPTDRAALMCTADDIERGDL